MRAHLIASAAVRAALMLGAGSGTAIAGVCDGVSTAASSPLTTVRVVAGLTRPVFVTAPPGDVHRLFIVEQDGTIRILKDGALLAAPFLDVSALTRSPADGGGNEQGLLGLAFHPGYASNGWFFVYHTDNTGASNLVARYTRSSANPDLADPATRQVVITFAHPSYTNHNGGMLAFRPSDGYLYIGTGDGGSSCDPSNNSQNGASNLGKLLRINVNALPYTIPADNPFVGPGGFNDEIWSYGLRNPWRYSFDRSNSDLYIGDVGQNQYEEIDYRAAGAPGGDNYGWDLYEGTHCPNPSCAGGTTCTLPGYIGPVLDYDHTGGACAVTGGYVYRGCRMPALGGTYFYADYCAAFLKSFRIQGGVATNQQDRTAELAPGGGLAINSVTSFGEDARGEIYIVDQGGEVFKIVPVLSNLETSGAGAQPFVLGAAAWTWEDLQASSSQPIQFYRVYRSASRGDGVFFCIFRSSTNTWAGGDLGTPGAAQAYSYLVTAVNAAGLETSAGTSTTGAPRVLSAAACP